MNSWYFFGLFWNAPLLSLVVGLVLLGLVLYRRMPGWSAGLLGAFWLYGYASPIWLLGVYGVGFVLLVLPPLRRGLVSGPIMHALRSARVLPRISRTEQTALEAGDTWIETDLFSGDPDFDRIFDEPTDELDEREKAFLDGPVEELCEMVDDWDVWRRRGLPEQAWDFIKEHKFFGMIVPEEYGGLGFSTAANSAVVQKLASRCHPLAITVMVPNSLGPAELLMHYGTEEQKDYYLPRLARGEEIPCFALTEPGAGSDAASLESEGVVFEGEDGRLMMRLNWEKRYITLSPIATVLGLAFRLRDPENLLGKGEDLGITCALVPTDATGVEVDTRHDPLGVPFLNGPTQGRDVEVPVEAIIGGESMAGKGWQMLMESLGVGRGVSLPASSAGASKLALRVASAHARVRRQFGIPIGKFEGIEDPLARIGGFNYLMEAARRFTCGGLDQGQKPAVVTAMVKYSFTELGREIINDAMDIRAGNAIQRGPRNLLAHPYMATPISITVEGANIMTRSLIIFGQGAIRSHPYLYDELMGLMERDPARFDRALFGHIEHVLQNGVRAFWLSVTRGRGAPIQGEKPIQAAVRRLKWASASFAFLADLALVTLGGALKRKETLSGRFADVFMWMYLATALCHDYRERGFPEAEKPAFEWALEHAFDRMQKAFEGLYQNLPVPGLGWLFRGPLWIWCRLNSFGSGPGDRLSHNLARALQEPGQLRERITQGIYEPGDPNEALQLLERALELTARAEPIEKRLREALREEKIEEGENRTETIRNAVEQEVLSQEEATLLRRARSARRDAIQVDSFPLEHYARHFQEPTYV